MNTKIKLLATIATTALLIGCASAESKQADRWTHPEGRTIDQIEQDLAHCRMIGHQRGGFQGGNAAWYLATRNGSQNDSIVRDCMIAKGYKLIPKGQP